MYYNPINLELVAKVAKGLKELNDKMVFIGGAVIGLYVDHQAAEEIRPTTDIDMTIDLVNYQHWVQLQERLSELGFFPDPQGYSICSYRFKDIAVDIMPSENSSLGPSNRWYKPGFNCVQQKELKEGITVSILSSPYFLATKLEALQDRGNSDFYSSHDFEDIIYLLDNRDSIVQEIRSSDVDVKKYIQLELKNFLAHPYADELLSMHIHPLIREERFKILKKKLLQIVDDKT